MSVTPAVNADLLVNVVPSVLSGGGNALDLIGMVLTQNTRPPIGQVLSFPDGLSVGNFFGPTSQEAALASIYFLGPDNSTAKPGALLFAQYAEQAVGAYLRSGPGLTLAAVQAVNASLTVTIDASPVTGSINLSTASSLSNAANLIASTLGIVGPGAGAYTASLSASVMTVSAVVNGPQVAQVTASLSGSIMTVTAVTEGLISVGDIPVGTGITAGTTIESFGTGTGGVGTYNLSENATTESAEAITVYSPNGALAVGSVVAGTGLTDGTYVASFGTGTGGVGTYNLSQSATTESNEAVTATVPAVQYDSISGSFVILSGTVGPSSTLAYATGAAAAPLLLTQATGAILSQGAAAEVPATFMDGIIEITQNWASFMTTWEGADAEKEAFAAWTNTALGGNRFAYAMWDTEIGNTESGGPVGAAAAIIQADYSGTIIIHEESTVDDSGQLAAFAMSYAASLDFTRLNGRTTLAYRTQSGLAPQIFSTVTAAYLNSYGINYYADFTTANQAFNLFQQGRVTGPFEWADSYFNQIWLNNELQLAILVGLTAANSVPYNAPGAATIESWCMDPINAGVNFGAIVAGVALSAAQANQVNTQAGVEIDQILTQRGWFLQVSPATAQVRAARTSPPCTLWYCDGGSVQQITLASIEIQ